MYVSSPLRRLRRGLRSGPRHPRGPSQRGRRRPSTAVVLGVGCGRRLDSPLDRGRHRLGGGERKGLTVLPSFFSSKRQREMSGPTQGRNHGLRGGPRTTHVTDSDVVSPRTPHDSVVLRHGSRRKQGLGKGPFRQTVGVLYK